MRKLNTKQRRIIIAGMIVFALMILFPPFEIDKENYDKTSNWLTNRLSKKKSYDSWVNISRKNPSIRQGFDYETTTWFSGKFNFLGRFNFSGRLVYAFFPTSEVQVVTAKMIERQYRSEKEWPYPPPRNLYKYRKASMGNYMRIKRERSGIRIPPDNPDDHYLYYNPWMEWRGTPEQKREYEEWKRRFDDGSGGGKPITVSRRTYKKSLTLPFSIPVKIDSTRTGFQFLALLAVVGGLTLVLGDRQKETTSQKNDDA